MEKPVTDLSVFVGYRNRQVIFNYYQDDDFLWKRNGFHFNSIHITSHHICFTTKDGCAATISLKDFPSVAINSDFQNYYVFHSGIQGRIEIYFP